MSTTTRPTDEQAAWRLRGARIRAGYETATDFARAHNINVTTYQHHESGRRGLTKESAVSYAKLLNADVSQLLYGQTSSDRLDLRLAGYVHGQGVVTMELPVETQEHEGISKIGSRVDFPDLSDMSVLRVVGNDMHPAFKDGDHVFYGRLIPWKASDWAYHGVDCIVQLADGRKLLRQVINQADGMATLVGYASAPILSVIVIACAPIELVRRHVSSRY